jgi:hypothetical protein
MRFDVHSHLRNLRRRLLLATLTGVSFSGQGFWCAPSQGGLVAWYIYGQPGCVIKPPPRQSLSGEYISPSFLSAFHACSFSRNMTRTWYSKHASCPIGPVLCLREARMACSFFQTVVSIPRYCSCRLSYLSRFGLLASPLPHPDTAHIPFSDSCSSS